MSINCFKYFKASSIQSLIPTQLNDPFGLAVPEICKIAVTELQGFIEENSSQWSHDFGLEDKNTGKGKMFGVLVVRNAQGALGYLSTFSGKLGNGAHPSDFVPSLFDLASKDYFLSEGMTALTHMSNEIKQLTKHGGAHAQHEAEALKIARKEKSISLQQALFDQYHFLNRAGESKSLNAIFMSAGNKKPASGAGECAAPKLLQYAFEQNMQPLAIAEFWWGKSNKSEDRKHGSFYPACNDKCRPILGYMLGD